MGGVESILRDQGYTVLGEKDGKYLVHLKEGKRFLVEQIEKDKHVSYIDFSSSGHSFPTYSIYTWCDIYTTSITMLNIFT